MDQLQLPMPKQGQCYASDRTNVAMINPAGLVLRIDKTGANPFVRDRHVLRPVTAFALSSKVNMGLNPGLNLSEIGRDEINRMRGYFGDKSIRFKGLEARNFGRLSVKPDDFSRGLITFFDPDFTDISKAVGDVEITAKVKPDVFDMRPQGEDLHDEQDDLYAEQRSLVSQAWGGGKRTVNEDAVDALWSSSVHARIDGHLIAGWLYDAEPGREDKELDMRQRLKEASLSYEEDVRVANPVLDV